MPNIQSVQINYFRPLGSEPHPASIVTRNNPIAKDLESVFLEGVAGETLRIKLSTGRVVDVALFERTPGFLSISTNGQITMKPSASNSIEIGVA
jgi:hypothetical protein